jgi:hypothetical protein
MSLTDLLCIAGLFAATAVYCCIKRLILWIVDRKVVS